MNASVGLAAPAVRVDFANVSRGHLLVYGWIWGLVRRVARAEIQYGEVLIDVLALAKSVPRPDVTRHFTPGARDPAAEDDHHGFYFCVALPDGGVRPSYLRLAVLLHSGEKTERVWPVGFGEAPVTAFFQEDRATLNWLLQNLSAPEAERLRTLALPPVAAASPERGAAPLQLQFAVELCCLLEERIVVVTAALNERDPHLSSARLTAGKSSIDLLKSLAASVPRAPDPKALPSLRGQAIAPTGLTFVAALAGAAAGAEVLIDVAAGPKVMRVRRTFAAPAKARQELIDTLNALEPDAAIGLLERIAALLEESPGGRVEWLAAEHRRAVERLPTSLQSVNPPYYLHVDSAVPMGDDGVFLNGWFNAEEGTIRCVAVHSGLALKFIDETWVRQARPDVSTHLTNLGLLVADNDHGYVAYVPLKKAQAPYVLSVTAADGTVRRMRLPTQAAAGTLPTVRSLLTAFNSTHRSLKSLLDQHVGPAVQAVWQHRRVAKRSTTVEQFGPPPINPAVSVIVPLYGRHDLADTQLALFADDADFQKLELIYFVDDPAIYDAFRVACHDLYGLYRVPFTLAFAGSNLGFAGANNAAAALARGQHLLLLNSDVMPKTTGWVGEMLSLYASLQEPGVLGVKLLYEDGSVQHAGMTFRRHAPWGDLWINEHLHKGQSAQGLTGVRKVEAATAACALVDTALYRELGGLSEDFIIGDFEDSDFCLRAVAAGRRNWVALDIELYHLERQSQDRIGEALWRATLTLYNCWQHHQRWAAQLARGERLRR